MPAIIKDLFNSKKFLFTLLLTAALLAGTGFGLLPKEDALRILVVLWPVYLGAQGIADIGDKLARAKLEIEEAWAANDKETQERKNEASKLLMDMIPGLVQGLAGQPFKGTEVVNAADNLFMTLDEEGLQNLITFLSSHSMKPVHAEAFMRLLTEVAARNGVGISKSDKSPHEKEDGTNIAVETSP